MFEKLISNYVKFEPLYTIFGMNVLLNITREKSKNTNLEALKTFISITLCYNSIFVL